MTEKDHEQLGIQEYTREKRQQATSWVLSMVGDRLHINDKLHVERPQKLEIGYVATRPEVKDIKCSASLLLQYEVEALDMRIDETASSEGLVWVYAPGYVVVSRRTTEFQYGMPAPTADDFRERTVCEWMTFPNDGTLNRQSLFFHAPEPVAEG